MSQTSPFTYTTVVNVCNELLQSGESPTLRKIQNRVGGSFSTVLPFYQRWQEEQNLAKQTEEDFSEAFRQAVLAEFGRITLKTGQQLMEQLNTTKEELNETQKILADYESKIEQLTEALTVQQQKTEQEHLKFQKELSAAQALIEAGAKRETTLQSQMENLRQSLHKAELKTAVAEALYQKGPNIHRKTKA